MIDLSALKMFLRYSDWANEQLVRSAAGLPLAHLDHQLDIGRGTLRRTLLHILAGETVWFRRWRGDRDVPWPDESEGATPGVIWDRFCKLFPERDLYLAGVRPDDFARAIVYRDSKGSLFSASLADMMVQMVAHSMHHRSQAVNILRRIGGTPLELDYMMWVRKAV